MKRVMIRIMIPACLIMSAGAAIADNSTDYFLQNDLAAIEAERPDGLSDHYQEYINWLLEEGYSPTSIIMSSVGRGLTLADVVYLMSRSRPESAERYFNTAEAILPSLPGWVCSTANAMGHRYDKPLDRDSVSQSTTLARVADLYFDENERFVKTPDWQNGVGHINVSIDELMKFKQAEIDEVSESPSKPVDSWWYLDWQRPNTKVVAVGLYPKERRVVLDARLSDLQALKQSGARTVPVMFMYNDNGHIPLSDVERVPGEVYGGSEMREENIDYIDYDDGEITASEVISRFESDGKRVPPVRDWRIGDHHLMVRTAELDELFDIPEKENIDPAEWQEAVNRLAQPSQKPLHISLLSDSDGDRFLDSTTLVAVAKEQSVKRLPVTFFYHGLERQPCGMPSACLPDVKAAAKAGSGRSDLFDDPKGKPPYRVPPVIIPPVSGPISPN